MIMDLKERINNIKELLSYCDNTETYIGGEKIEKFLCDFFRNNDKFEDPCYWGPKYKDSIHVKLHLYTAFLQEDKIFPIEIQYMTHYMRDDEEWAYYWFLDEDVYYEYEWMKPKDGINYSDFPDWVWEDIQNQLYIKVKEKLQKSMEATRNYYLYKAKLDYEDKLNTYNKIINKYEHC